MSEIQPDDTPTTPPPSVPDCGLYIVLPPTDDHEKQNFQLGQALHAANRFSTYAVNRHVVEFRHKPKSPSGLKDIVVRYRNTCKRNGFIFLVADDPLLAREVEADGVLCSSTQMATQSRKVLGEEAIIGLRCATLLAAKTAMELELDFVSFYTDAKGDSLMNLLNWWGVSSENPVAIEGPFTPESCASFVRAGATFIQSDYHIWTHPSGNMMQGAVNMLDAIERHKPLLPKAH